MKKLKNILVLLPMLAGIVSCGEDDKPGPKFDVPTIAISSPADGSSVEIGQTMNVVIDVAAEAGLVSLTADGMSIATYGGTELSDQFTYEITDCNTQTGQIVFEVNDAEDETASVTFSYSIVEPSEAPFIISDLAGASTTSSEIDVENQGWDLRTIYTFTNTSDLSSTEATMQFVASQGDASFGVDNPDASDVDDCRASNQVLEISSVAPPDGSSSWGGHYVFAMIDLGTTIPTSQLENLPQITFDGTTVDIDGDETDDASVASIASGYTRVIQVDAYYDDTVNPDLSMSAIKQIPAIYGLDLSTGYQVDLILASSDPHTTVATGEIQGMYAAYSAWIPEPNKWVTLTFEVASEAQQQFLDDGDGINNEDVRNPASISEVDAITIVPAYSHEIWGAWDDVAQVLDSDTNPIYFRNLRIINAQ